MTPETNPTDDNPNINRFVEPNSHGFRANFNYNKFGLQPWLAADSIIKQHQGAFTTEIQALGDTWTVTLYSTEGNLVPPQNHKTPAGTEVQHEHIREFRLKCQAHDDTGQRKANFHIRPRWQSQEGENKYGYIKDTNVPHSLANTDTDAVSVHVQGSNIPFEQYHTLITLAAGAVGINSHYFSPEHLHETNNTQSVERHVRTDQDLSGPIHSRTGPIAQLAHLKEDDRSGYRKLVQNDDDENGHNVPGYHHYVTLGPKRIQEVLPKHQLPKKIKHYHIKNTAKRSETDPLSHPKLEVSYESNRWNQSMGADPETLADIQRELDEMLYSILHTAGLSLRAGDTYVEDAYFTNQNHTTTANAIDLDLTQIRHEQQSIVFKHFGDGLAPTDKETLKMLVADGGTVSPRDIAESTGRHQDTVYDSLARMNDLVKHTYGEVSLKSTYVSELVADALNQAEDAIARATNAAATAVNVSKSGLDDTTTAFYAWCSKHGVDNLGGDSPTIDLGEVESISEVRKIIRMGLNHWQAMGRDELIFKQAKVQWVKVEHQNNLNYLSKAPRKQHAQQRAFSLLK
jgi:hypothetical protein